MNKLIFYFIISAIIVFFSNCATIFIPGKQKLSINSSQPNSSIYLDNVQFGEGSSAYGKVRKRGAMQIVIKTPGYKDHYSILAPTHRPIAFWPLYVLNTVNFYGWFIDLMVPKLWSYEKVNNYNIDDSKLVLKGQNDKFIEISNISINMKNKSKDIYEIPVRYSKDNLIENIENAEKKKDSKEAAIELKKLNKGKKDENILENDNEKIKYNDIKYSSNVYKTLKNTGFIDTLNRVFTDNNNSLILEGKINKIYIYNIYKKNNRFTRTKIFMTWYIKNSYDEIIDSVETKEFSGDFAINKYQYSESEADKMFADAVDISYLSLHKNQNFTKHLKYENKLEINDNFLTLGKPSTIVTDKSDASIASVIIKTQKGHGSGFAITNDGYIITNYHVIAGKLVGKLNKVKVITSTGEEIEGLVVRTNKYKDLALIKVDKKFEKAFSVSNIKTFKNLQDVYTIGAPKSIELGQSISTGVISNERNQNNNYLLQLGMSVNSGNSGGPLYDATGKLHGIIVSKLGGQNTEGVSFAIPAHMIEEYLKLKIN